MAKKETNSEEIDADSIEFSRKYDREFLQRLKAFALSASDVEDVFISENFLKPLGFGPEVRVLDDTFDNIDLHLLYLL